MTTNSRKVKIAIIGAGTAGLTALGKIRHYTDDFVIINAGHYGTTCARVGCMPSKALIQIADEFHGRNHFDKMGIRGAQHLQAEIPAVLKRVREHRDFFTSFVLPTTEQLPPHQHESGVAEFIDSNTIRVNDTLFECEAIIIATGSRPIVPKHWLETDAIARRLITSEEIFEQTDLPKRIALIGMGVIGLELGQALSRLGVEVFGFGRSGAIASLTDPRVNQVAGDIFSQEFPISFDSQLDITATEKGLQISNSKTSVEVDKALVTLGRKPNLENLKLEKAGIELNARGIPQFDPNSMQIGDKPIFIIGDANHHFPVVHQATDDARIATQNALNLTNIQRFHRPSMLALVFSDPQIAFIGSRYKDLDLDNTVIAETSFDFGRPLIMEKPFGLARLYADKTNKCLIGGECIGPHIEHVAHALAWCVQQKTPIIDIIRMPFYHPTIEEGFQEAVRDLGKQLYSRDELFELHHMSDS